MNNFFIDLFRNDTFGPKMGIFNITHILALLFTFISCAGFCAIFYFKKEKTKKLALDILTICVIGLYFLDFFIHPFMNGGTDTMIVDKLPFHLCTSMCLLIGLARVFPKQLGFLKTPFTILGMVGGLMYIMVPTALVDEY